MQITVSTALKRILSFYFQLFYGESKIIKYLRRLVNNCTLSLDFSSKEHLILRYNFESEVFEAYAVAPIILNGTRKDKTDRFITVKALDQIEFPCDKCYMPHLFYLV